MLDNNANIHTNVLNKKIEIDNNAIALGCSLIGSSDNTSSRWSRTTESDFGLNILNSSNVAVRFIRQSKIHNRDRHTKGLQNHTYDRVFVQDNCFNDGNYDNAIDICNTRSTLCFPMQRWNWGRVL
jgi:hypothetical protein